MRILVLGANGRTGQIIVQNALDRGYTVTALVRRRASMDALAHANLTVVEGTPLQRADVEKCFASSAAATDPIHAVLVTLTQSRVSDSPFAKPLSPLMMIRDCVRNATAVMKQQRAGAACTRLVIMNVFGAGSSWASMSWIFKAVFLHTNMSLQLEDHNAVDAEVRAADGLDWTLVRPCVLKDAEAKEVRVWGEDGKGIGLTQTITRASVAKFMLDSLEGTEWIKRATVISN